MSLLNKTILITGASRGIGLAIAKRAAQDGANVVIAAKTDKPHPKLEGTIYSAAEECEKLGGKSLPIKMDITDQKQIESCVNQTVEKFGGIDILVNNASAIDNSGTLKLSDKKYQLINDVNGRGTFLMSKYCIPHLLKSDNAHVLNLSPPLNLDPRWFNIGGVGYTISKYNMSMAAFGMNQEYFGNIGFNCLWPKTAIATAAVEMLFGKVGMKTSRNVDIMSDTAHWILTQNIQDCNGEFFIDEEVATQRMGMTSKDLKKYNNSKILPLMPDLYVGNPVVLEKISKQLK